MNVIVTSDRNVTLPLDAVVGSIRSFGRIGPLYEVLRVCEPSTGSNVMLRVRVVESGEELEYSLSAALDDPLAR
jgi:hypothetical protein